MKRTSKQWLAFLLACSMVISPLTYVNAYASESETDPQETQAAESAQPDSTEGQAAGETADAGQTGDSGQAAAGTETAGTAGTDAAEAAGGESTTSESAGSMTAGGNAAATEAASAAEQKKESESSAAEKVQKQAAADSEDSTASESSDQAELKTYTITVSVVNSKGKASGMYAMDSAVATRQADGTWLVRMHQTSKNRNYLAFTGDKEKATKHQVDWYVAGGSDGYWFTVPVKSLETPVAACFSKTANVEAGKDWSETQTITFDTATMTETETESPAVASDVNCQQAPVIAVTGISLDESALSLAAGTAKTLTAAVAPEDATDPAVTWVSSDESVATVSGGVVTALAEGTATITAEAGGFMAGCTVSVYTPGETEGFLANGTVKAVFAADDTKKPGQDYGMFKIDSSTAVVKNDQVEVTIWVKPASSGKFSYDAIYIGSKDDETKEPVITGEVDTEKNLEKFQFAIPVSELEETDGEIHFVPRSASKGTWSTSSSLALRIPTEFVSEDEGKKASETIGAVYGAGEEKEGTVYKMFKIARSTAVVQGTKIQISIWVSPASSGRFTYSYIYLGNRTDETKEPLIEGTEEDGLQKYTFTVPYSARGTSVPFVPIKADKTSMPKTQLALTIPSAFSSLSITSQPTAETVAAAGKEIRLSVAAEGASAYQWQYSADGSSWTDCTGDSAQTAEYSFIMSADLAGSYRCVVSDVDGNTAVSDTAAVTELTAPTVTGDQLQVVKNDGTVYKMFKVDSSEVLESGGQLNITLSTKNTSYDKIYLGTMDDADKSSAIQGTGSTDDGWSFSFSLPDSYKGSVIPVSLGKPDGSWYTGQYLWMYIPAQGIDYPTVENEISVIQGGTGSAYGDFRIASSKAVLTGEKVQLTLKVTGNKWTKLYQGVQADTSKTPVYTGSYDADADVTTFTFAVSADRQGMYIPVTPGNASGWFKYARDLFIRVPNLDGQSNTTADGVYDLYGSAYPTSSYAGLNFERESSVSISGDTATVTLVTQGKYDKIYIGNVSDAASVKEANAVIGTARTDIGDSYKSFTFMIPVSALGQEINYVVHGSSDNSTLTNVWAAKQSSFYINGILEKTGSLPDTDPDPDPDPAVKVPEDGTYSIEVELTEGKMFNVTDCTLTVKNGKMTAVMTVSGTGYDYLYLGTAKQAKAADKSSWIHYGTDANGKYTFTISVDSLDQEIAIAGRSAKYAQTTDDCWYNKKIRFNSDTLKKLSDSSGGTDKPGTTTDPASPSKPSSGNDGKADKESKYESDLTGSTSKVNSSTALADGVYTPDRFTWSGGTGKVSISCTKITVQNGQAYATLVFDSEYYQYVKANGNTYYTTKGSGTATVVIPVALNQNNTIKAMTTKMSAAHEVTYQIFVYLAAAGNGTAAGRVGNTTLDNEAPEIMGLTYESETQLEYAQYFKIYNYDQGITLLEIDMTKDTARDPENAEDDVDTTDTEKSGDDMDKTDADSADAESTDDAMTEEESAAADSAEEGTAVLSEGESAAELYKGNVVKYLLVPENVEIPVGLDQDMIVVTIPEDQTFETYAASDAILERLEELELLDQVAAIGSKKKDCQIEAVVERMKAADKEETPEVIFGGKSDKPKYKALVKQKIDLALLPAELLPREDEDADTAEQQNADTTEQKKADTSGKTGDDLTVEEQTERLEEITEKFALLGIPVIVDRSEDEESDLAKYEWVKVYGALFGCTEETDALFEAAVSEAEQQGK